MRKKFFIITLSCICFLSISCARRDTSTPQKALLGHWRSINGRTDTYISESNWTWVDNNSGNSMTNGYIILESNLKTFELKIKIRKGYTPGHDEIITFSNDRRFMTRWLPLIPKATFKDKYIDAKMSP